VDIFACLQHPSIVQFFEDGEVAPMPRRASNKITYCRPFCDLREVREVKMDLVASVVIYYLFAEGSLSYFEERTRKMRSVSLSLFHKACDLHAYAVDAMHRTFGEENETTSGENDSSCSNSISDSSDSGDGVGDDDGEKSDDRNSDSADNSQSEVMPRRKRQMNGQTEDSSEGRKRVSLLLLSKRTIS
jgi:hypothetical protein